MTYREVPGFSGYKVSASGEVLGRRGRPIKFERLDGYLTFKAQSDAWRLIRDGAHQFVALAFIGPKPSAKHQVAHGDGIRDNNCLGNLRWATGAENVADCRKHGTHRPNLWPGEAHPMAKLTAAQVAEIRSRYTGAAGEPAAFAAEFGISKRQLFRITGGQNWTGDPVASLTTPPIAITPTSEASRDL